MTNLAQRAADELNADGPTFKWDDARHYDNPTMQTTMRLIAKNDELQARVDELTTRRSEPMPEPVPDYIKRKVCEEIRRTNPIVMWQLHEFDRIHNAYTIARLIWERGDVEDVDPLLIEARATAAQVYAENNYQGAPFERGGHDSHPEVQIALAALKRGMELAKEIG